jgi:hypothetical protein
MDIRNQRREKHTMTFEEHLDGIRKKKERNKKEEKEDRKKLEGFVRVHAGTFKLDNNGQKSQPIGFAPGASMADVFLRLATPEVIDYLTQAHLSTEAESLLPKKLKMGTEESRRCVYRYFCQRLYIIAAPASDLRSNFNTAKTTFGPGALGYSVFEKLLVHFPITFEVAALLDRNYQGAMTLGRVITMDEKLKPFQGDSPHKRFVPNKDPNWGHWITELQTKGAHTGLPYLVGQYPLLHNGANKCVEIFQWSRGAIPPGSSPITLADPYYLDAKSLTLLESRSEGYLCGVNSVRFREVWDLCRPFVKKIGDSVAFWNFRTNQLAMMLWDENFGTKYVLTNAFTWVMNEKKVDLLPVREAYKFFFNTCDRFNQHLHDKQWPYKRQHWKNNFDDFYFSALLMNTYVLWHEINVSVDKIPWKDFTKRLSMSVWARVC